MNNSELEKKINSIVSELVNKQGYINSTDVLIRLGYLSQTDYENWRKGKIGYLEKACQINLGKLTTINRIIRQISRKMKLKPSWTAYNRYGKGPKKKLQFSKSGEENIEKAYSTHYLNKYRITQLNELKRKPVPDENENPL
ncbi:MAG: hypothetical protein M0Q51_16665 [Bacteroidales bacterium]|nr:hypothetical protein [Bacteroidales bacterium]